MLTMESNQAAVSEAYQEEQLPSTLLSCFALTINTPVNMSGSRFVTGVCHYVSGLASRLGMTVACKSSTDNPDALLLTLEGEGIEISESLPLRDEEGHYFSEITLQAVSGILAVHSRNREGLEALGVDYATVMAAVNALTGLFAQAYSALSTASDRKTASCSPLAVSLLGAGQYIADATAADELSLPEGSSDLSRQPPFCSTDGILFELESLDAGPWRQFWQSLDIDMALAGQGWKAFQLRYAKAISPLPLAMVEALKSLPFSKIKASCLAAGVHVVEVAPLAQYAEMNSSYNLWKNGPWHFSHRDEDGEATSSRHQPDSVSSALPLAGVKVVESCRRIQGPLATHILALLGAQVTRIEPPGGDPLRGMLPVVEGCSARFNAINRLKDVVEINIKETVGKQQIFQLAQNADVFIHNWAPHKAAQLSLDHGDLAAVNAGLIYSYAGGWGNGAAGSPVSDSALPGTDFMVQAVSGVASMIARNQVSDKAQGGSLFTVLDSLGGAVAAQGVVIALLMRRLHGKGCYLETSLLGGASLLNDVLLEQIYRKKAAQPEVVEAVFETQTRPIAVSLPSFDEASGVWGLLTIPSNDRHLNPPQLLQKIQQAFLRRSAEDWLTELAALRVSASLITEDLSQLAMHFSTQQWLEKASYEMVKSPWRFV